MTRDYKQDAEVKRDAKGDKDSSAQIASKSSLW